MKRLSQSEREFLVRALILEVIATPPEFGFVAHALAAQVADKLDCTEELREAAGMRAVIDRLGAESE